MKRFSALLITLVILIGALYVPVTSVAADEIDSYSPSLEMSVLSENTKHGDTVYLSLALNGVYGLWSGNFSLEYDPQVVELVEFKDSQQGDFNFNFGEPCAGLCTFSFMTVTTARFYSEDRFEFGTLSFKVIGNLSDTCEFNFKCDSIDIDYSVDTEFDLTKKSVSAVLTVSANAIGDVNGDGRVLANDARLALRASALLDTLDKVQTGVADVNGDGRVLADDARQILRRSALIQDKWYIGDEGDTVPENDMNVSVVTDENICVDDTFDVVIQADSIYGLEALNIEIPYDDELFEYVSGFSTDGVAGSAKKTYPDGTTGSVLTTAFMFMTSAGNTGAGVELAHFSLRARNTGTYLFEPEVICCKGVNCNSINSKDVVIGQSEDNVDDRNDDNRDNVIACDGCIVLGHTWDSGNITKAATCSTDGEIEYTCVVCDHVWTKQIPASGHTFEEWKTVKPAAETSEGTEERTCSVCGETETRAIPKLGARQTDAPEYAVTSDDPNIRISELSANDLTPVADSFYRILDSAYIETDSSRRALFVYQSSDGLYDTHIAIIDGDDIRKIELNSVLDSVGISGEGYGFCYHVFADGDSFIFEIYDAAAGELIFIRTADGIDFSLLGRGTVDMILGGWSDVWEFGVNIFKLDDHYILTSDLISSDWRVYGSGYDNDEIVTGSDLQLGTVTEDFKEYRPLTFEVNEKLYSELHNISWPDADGLFEWFDPGSAYIYPKVEECYDDTLYFSVTVYDDAPIAYDIHSIKTLYYSMDSTLNAPVLLSVEENASSTQEYLVETSIIDGNVVRNYYENVDPYYYTRHTWMDLDVEYYGSGFGVFTVYDEDLDNKYAVIWNHLDETPGIILYQLSEDKPYTREFTVSGTIDLSTNGIVAGNHCCYLFTANSLTAFVPEKSAYAFLSIPDITISNAIGSENGVFVFADDGTAYYISDEKFEFPDEKTDYETPGDIDGEDGITAKDARLALRASAGLENLTEKQTAAADVNGDGKILADDARQILRFSAKLQTEFKKAG